MPDKAEIVEIDEEAAPVDGKTVAIKLAAMAVVTTAALVATHVVINQINKRKD